MDNICKEAITNEDRKVVKNLQDIEVVFHFTKNPYLKIYTKKDIPLSDIVLLLHNFAITTSTDITYNVEGIWVHQIFIDTDIEALQKAQKNVIAIIKQALQGKITTKCKLYQLVIVENMDLDAIVFVRSMIKYLSQLLIDKKDATIIKIFLHYHHIVRIITEYFFNQKPIDEHSLFKNIKNYEDDKVLRIFYNAVINIQKTNFFLGKETKSYKFNLSAFKQLLPSLQPNIEIFVYHNDFLGIHLRVSPISRGGIRWSDREDFREEIKSLMITQEAKNAIIIPSGGKGGIFIEKKVTKEQFKEYYTMYIDAMLDLIAHTPKKDEDFYFVVAADKGTSDMSDVANAIAIQRGYWLKDAFASGGSYGYNHKKLGVTANGAWISAARHFVQRGIDIFNDPITVVGTGSMRGDVFGNGMLINPNVRLIGAISSHEIFIDPNPDPAKAYQERKRLFEAQKGWMEYDKRKISEGGGVFLREQKDIKLSAQIQKLLDIKENYINGEELARKLLCAQVDLLYIGGVGTYVKSSEELNIYIADKINEPMRVDAAQLRCYAVCEGGNLGFTQRARIEYAKNGGKINLDSIDNSAGVDTSDHEVNLKIVLNKAVQDAKIDEEGKREILKNLTQDVLSKVFETNFAQPLAMTLDEIRSKNSLEEFIKTVDILEKRVEFFKRAHFDIPKIKDFENILTPNGTIVRPILGVLLSFSKIFLKNLILQSPLVQEPFFEHYLYKYFPKSLYPLFEKEVLAHPLRQRIIATVAANIIINNAGAAFIADFEELGQEKFLIKIKSYLLLYTLLSVAKVKKELYDNEKHYENLYAMLLEIEHSIDFSIKWILRNYEEINIEPFHILNYKNTIASFLQYEEGKSINFFKYIDLVKFIMLAIYIKELKEYRLDEVLELLMQIIALFKIDRLLQIINQFTPKDMTGKEIKNQLVDLVEYFVTAIAKDVVLFTRSKENLKEGLHNYLREKMIDTDRFSKEIEDLSSTPSNLMKITSTVHKLLLEAI